MSEGPRSSRARFQKDASPFLSKEEQDELAAFYQSYQKHLKDHIPLQSPRQKIVGVQEEPLRAFLKRGFHPEALNELARTMGWPVLSLELGSSKEVCEFYNRKGREGLLRDALWRNYEAISGLFQRAHQALTLNTEDVEGIDVFVVAGHAGPDRGQHTAALMVKNNKAARVITTGDKANYMGEKSFSMTEAQATALSILQGGEGKIRPEQILLEEESRITSHHGANVLALIEEIARLEKRPIRVGAVTSSFHSLRYVTGLDRALGSASFVREIVPFSSWAEVENKTRVGHIVNEYVKIIFQLCARDLT